jgi:hypothetical protein
MFFINQSMCLSFISPYLLKTGLLFRVNKPQTTDKAPVTKEWVHIVARQN